MPRFNEIDDAQSVMSYLLAGETIETITVTQGIITMEFSEGVYLAFPATHTIFGKLDYEIT